ncbi:flocculation protein FLO11 [Cephus cinctus]|uniref:Flocculation protein FLO11 n=1 Tax=Cephus cinctus TaxID=211228 RepID=A0AAJ7BZ80_CEPCN|nr:flocculation protein FLO11 [Cephus cinctus]XP_024941927.1 flocculation protein FLO11 [Cephus cinctus]
MSGQSGGHRLRLSKLNEQLTCKLCGGYFIDATTIIECLHSFCRSCIVKYLESNKYCPICEVQVHKSKPLLNIRPDHTLQDIVYKLVPGCYQNEMRCRREFYTKHPEARNESMSPESRGEPTESHIYSPDESLSLSLEYYNPNLKEESDDASKETSPKPLPRRYLRCPAAVTVFHLQKLIRAKYGLTDAHRVDVMYKEEPLCGSYTLMDVMYIYHWRRKVPLHLSYRIFESSPKRIKLSDDNPDFKQSLSNAGISPLDSKEDGLTKREWKEVQLKISETGVMSVTDITSPDNKKSTKIQDAEDQKGSGEMAEAVNKSDIVLQPSDKDGDGLNSTEQGKSSSKTDEIISKEAKMVGQDAEKSIPSQTNKNSGEPKDSRGQSNDLQEANEAKKTQENIQKKSEDLQYDKADNSIRKINNPDKSSSATSSQKNSEEKSNADSVIVEDKDTEGKQILTNNNVINTEAAKVDDQKITSVNEVKSTVPPSAGSKIDALSAKLQFQPKVGQVNNTYSKKTPKDKRTASSGPRKFESKETVKVDPKASESGNSKRTNCNANNKLTTPVNVVSTQSKTTATLSSASQTSCLLVSSAASATYVTAPSAAVSSIQNSSLADNRNTVQSTQSTTVNLQQTLNSPGQRMSFSEQSLTTPGQRSSTSTTASSSSVTQKMTFSRNSSLPPSSESLASIGLNVSTAMMNMGQGCPTFPYTVQDLVSNNMLKSPSKTSGVGAGQKSTLVSSQNTGISSTGSGGQPCSSPFAIQTPSMSIYSVSTSTKNNVYPNVSEGNNTLGKQTLSKGGFEMSNAYSVPPCPDAIPISLMKPTVRKHEVIAKGTNLNEICAKIGTSGSKINDICAKIGENSKEKNKAETRSRPEIPDLLKIARKTPSTSSSGDVVVKHIPNIPNVPIFTPSNSLANTESKGSYQSKDTGKSMISSTTTSQSGSSSHSSQKIPSLKKQSQPVGYKTLKDPPKTWNPTLSKNNYVAVKNQTKEMQNQSQAASTSESGSSKPIPSKPAKIFKMRNMPRYLGNPASGVKPMYGMSNESKDKEQSSSGSKNSTLNMMKIDPKTLSPIVSTVNSPIVSPPPYSPNARSYQNTPFPRDICRTTGSPISPRNSPVNMLSTNPFIPSPTPNTNPRLIYSHFPPPFPDASRFPNPLIRTPIGIPSASAYHSSLPPSINKLYQRTNYIPQTTAYSPVTQPPTVQRIPPSTHSSSPKSPKMSSSSASSSFNLAKTETQTSIPTSVENVAIHLGKSQVTQQEVNSAFNLSKSGTRTSAASEFLRTTSPDVPQSPKSTTSNSTNQVKQQSTPTSSGKTKPKLTLDIPPPDNVTQHRVKDEESQKDCDRTKDDTQDKIKASEGVAKVDVEEVTVADLEKNEKSSTKLNGEVNPEVPPTSGKAKDDPDTKSTENTSESKTSSSKEQTKATDGIPPSKESSAIPEEQNKTDTKNDELGKSGEQIQAKKSEAQRNKAES